MTNNNAGIDIKKLMEEKGPKVFATSQVTVEVRFTASELINDLADVYQREVLRVTRYTSRDDYLIEAEEFKRYLITLAHIRILQASNQSAIKKWKHIMRNLMIPTFFHTILLSIGTANDYDFGLTFKPVMEIDAKDLMSESEMFEINRKLSFLNREGFVCTDGGIPMDPEGDLSFMAIMNIQNEVLGYKKDHPVYGFYSAFFKNEILNDVISPNFLRVQYGTESEYRVHVNQVVRVNNGSSVISED